MKLWRFSDPSDFRYARASRRGTWEGTPSRRVRPLVIEWEPESDVVGDFTWPGFDTDIVITDRVGKALKQAGLSGFELAPVEMVENSEESKRASIRPRVKLPYVGPPLWDLWITAWAQLDCDHSTVKLTGKQPDGTEQYEVSGVEHREAIWDRERMELIKQRHPRIDGQGLFVRTDTAMFRLAQFPGWIFCTDEVKHRIESCEFTNVSFLQMGDVLRPATNATG